MQSPPHWLAVALLFFLPACGVESEPELQPVGAVAVGLTQPALEFELGDTLCLLGGALAERMQHHAWLETRLQERFPDKQLRLRNLGFGADELNVHQRTANFGKFSADGMQSSLANERFVPWDRYLEHEDAKLVFAFFGYNESFAGPAGLPAFRANMKSFIEHVVAQKYDGESSPELVLFSSIPHEDLGNPDLPDGTLVNANIQLYNAAMQELASAEGLRFVDLYGPLQARYAQAASGLTINGIHLNNEGNRILSEVIDAALFGEAGGPILEAEPRAALRDAVLEKNLLWFNRYRATDGYNVYGNRSRLTYVGAADGKSYSNFDVLQRELDYLDGQVAARDKNIWGLALGQASSIDESNLPPLIEVATNKPGAGAAGSHVYQQTGSGLDELTAGPGLKVEVFADERQFPELVNPVQMAWDTRGRLWVAVWPTYPHWKPDQEMNDKLLILEDTDGDGRANTCTVFADDLHNPTGFEFWNGGVLLAAQPDLLFLKDTDGDDRADHKEHLLHGLSSADTHHGANSFVIGPDGALYFQEGTFHQSQVESIYGPVRQRGAGAWRFDPRTWRVERYIPYGFANPHGHVFDAWGQDFITDGTGNANYFALGFSGHLPQPLNHASYFTFFNQRTRPAGGTEILSSGHFPEEYQGNYLIANVIGFRGIHRYQITENDSGFGAVELAPIVESTSLNFRPVDLEMGPDGALYFLDWHNALIGHMQHHLRDPSRDVRHGRVYRVTAEGREPLQPEPIAGASIEALLEILKSPEDRARYRARLELSGHDSDAVVSAAKAWVANLDASSDGFEHQRLEALWLHQQHNRLDVELLSAVLASPDARARAAATRVVRNGRHSLPNAIELLLPMARDENARVRLESVVAASFLGNAEAASLALEVLRRPMDKYLDYGLKESMRSLEVHWKTALKAGQPLAAGNPAGIEYLLERVDAAELGMLPHIPGVLMAILTRHGVAQADRREAAVELAGLRESSPGAEFLAAMERVDASNDGHADHVLYQLSDLLAELDGTDQSITREQMLRQAEAGMHRSMRSIGYSNLIQHDGSVQAAVESALQSAPRLQALFEGVGRISDPQLRLGLSKSIQSCLYEVPAGLSQSGPGTGLEVNFYSPRPRNASAEAFAALSPSESLHADRFKHAIGPALDSDSFGLSFSGTLFAPSTGLYSFSTTSDDGSRLYIDGDLVVNNDGDHGPLTRSGELELSAGAHRVALYYYEAGGGDSLSVSWSGPDFEALEIPASALGSGMGNRLRESAVRALSHLPEMDFDKLEVVIRLLENGSSLGSTLDLLASVDLSFRDVDEETGMILLERVSQALVSHLTTLSPEKRTTASVARAIQLGNALAERMGAPRGVALRTQLEGLGGLSIVIRTLPHQMRYDITEFDVQAGRPVSIIFENNDMMPHNLVISLPGSLAEVGQAAEKLTGSENAAAQFIPATNSVLWHTGLVMPGQSESLVFVAPEQVGDHPYVCTYPGHWRVMNGVMHVLEAGSSLAQVKRRGEGAAKPLMRTFVKDWSLADLQPKLTTGWEQGASLSRGKQLFTDAGCVKCHTAGGSDAGNLPGGPDLSAIWEKFTGAELLAHVIEPSKDVLPEYIFYIFEVEGRADVIGRILEEDTENLRIVPSLLDPDASVLLSKSKIKARFDTQLSPMPTGLLVTLEAGEILDLLLYLQTPNKE